MKRRTSTSRRLATTAVVILLVVTVSRMFGSPDEQDNASAVFYGSSQQVDSTVDLPLSSNAGNDYCESQATGVDTGVNPRESRIASIVASTPEGKRPSSKSRGPYVSVSQERYLASSQPSRSIEEAAGHDLYSGANRRAARRPFAHNEFTNPAAIADPTIILDLPGGSNPQLMADRRARPKPVERIVNQGESMQVANENDFVPAFAPLASLAPANERKGTAGPVESFPFRQPVNEGAGEIQNVALAQPVVQPAGPPTPAQGPSGASQGTTEYRLAEVPKVGDRWKSETPTFDRCANQSETFYDDFSPDAIDENLPYDPYPNQQIYQGKTLNANQRPLLELGQPWYQLGQLSPGSSILGNHNNVNPQLVVFGDYRQAIASNTVNGDNVSQVAFEMNTFWSLFVTGTERLVTGVSPLDNGGGNTRWLLDEDRFEFEGDFDFDFGYLEGDLGAITGGLIGETLPFDLPFAAGLTPIFIQNGIWLNDAVEGVFATIPARNSPKLNISNMDITFAYIYDQINSAAFEGDNSAAKAYAMFLFIEALNGYFEIDYAFLEDRDVRDRSYHNIGLAFTRRFGRFISHSTRVIANAGQDVSSGDQTADGLLFLSENSLITRNPYTVIPYFNFFAGFDTPQSFAGDAELVNTGILFESDGMTGYPTLDGRAQDAFGYAIGLNLLAQDFSQQLILETAAVFRNDDSDLPGDQYGVGMRYQLPLTNSWIFRTDAMYGFFRNDDDDLGMRMELRKKF